MDRRDFLRTAALSAAFTQFPLPARTASAQDSGMKKVYLVYKTHLDVGFTDFADNVMDRYCAEFIPGALALARRLREEQSPTRMVWTTGSWLVHEFLERATSENRRAMEEAIAAGDVAWHALPMTFHSEAVEAEHFAHALSISKRLDSRFGKKTIAAKMTDVPGHTRSVVPILREAGVEFLHIGVNPASSAPDVPNVFVWRDEDSGADIIVAYNKGSYGDLVAVDGMDSALLVAMTSDNQGPPSVESVADVYKGIADRFPGAEAVAGRLDDYARDLLGHKGGLPVVTGELGDTWIHGVGSDPIGMARYRRLCSLRSRWVHQGLVKGHEKEFERFSDLLLLVPEHTWGLDEKTFLADFENYSKKDFQARRNDENYRKLERSWADKRGNLDRAVKAIEHTPLAADARKAFYETTAERPDLRYYERVDDPFARMETDHFHVRFSPAGGLDMLESMYDGRAWAGPENQWGLFQYEVFSAADFKRFHDAYTIVDVEWARLDLGKICVDKAMENYEKVSNERRLWTPTLKNLYRTNSFGGVQFITELQSPEEACERFGCPRELFVEWFFIQSDVPNGWSEIWVDCRFFGKDASRIGEALWLSFNPIAADPAGWVFEKMGRAVSPLDVVSKGNRHLHAVDPGVVYKEELCMLRFDSPDASLCAPGKPALLDFDVSRPDMRQGVHFNLYNNVWGTNFRSWYDEDTRYRFDIRFMPDPRARTTDKAQRKDV